MEGVEHIEVEVACAFPERQVIIALRMPAGATVADALDASGIATVFPALDLARTPVGVFGTRCATDRVLRSGDRVEVYRPLAADPKTIRRRRARAASSRRR